MYTLLSSLAKYGIQGTEFSKVNNWIMSGLFSAQVANNAYSKKYINMRIVPGDDMDIFNPNDGIRYVYITQTGLKALKQYKSDANYGTTHWNPNQKLKEFMQNYDPNDDY